MSVPYVSNPCCPAHTLTVPQVRALLQRLVKPKFSLEQRLAVLQPLAAAAGLAPPVPGLTLHSGAMLFALTDPECAKLMVDIIKGEPVSPDRLSDGMDMSYSCIHMTETLGQHECLGRGVGAGLADPECTKLMVDMIYGQRVCLDGCSADLHTPGEETVGGQRVC